MSKEEIALKLVEIACNNTVGCYSVTDTYYMYEQALEKIKKYKEKKDE